MKPPKQLYCLKDFRGDLPNSGVLWHTTEGHISTLVEVQDTLYIYRGSTNFKVTLESLEIAIKAGLLLHFDFPKRFIFVSNVKKCNRHGPFRKGECFEFDYVDSSTTRLTFKNYRGPTRQFSLSVGHIKNFIQRKIIQEF